ncbi:MULTISPECIES: hydrogenase expression/formation protein HypE [Kosmotoga]|uniref:hydrogenase expression/formation protein HypE n=1 Tax=Kosmotoga TaxID=651456 RepID=UPI000674051B|nr:MULTISPECIES: hydrogenase expression/formation protein HypE [Kosmotoga]
MEEKGSDSLKERIITLHHNSGKKQFKLLKHIEKLLGSTLVSTENDSGFLEEVVDTVTTDSFTISPVFFPGGDIGKLSVCGSINDLVMTGAKPKYITLSVVLEEGFEFSRLDKIIDSIRKELDENGVKIIAGDTKVMEHGALDKIVINTTCLGEVLYEKLCVKRIETNDLIIITGPIGLHGAAIMAERKGFQIDFQSDCRVLTKLLAVIKGLRVHAMRDPTRGGLAQILNEFSHSTKRNFAIYEDKLPIPGGVKTVSEILGIDPLYLACEGTAVIICHPEDAQDLLERLKNAGFDPSTIGFVGGIIERPLLILKTRNGAKRVLPMLVEELTPRIC